ncbi:MAG TPA: DUF763 domain-containing protein, partial [Candidatus Bathyarchaeia archaeon]|nr:DUF763 domain-containing protein [Candidatus Bathyarchaeia archaeon]
AREIVTIIINEYGRTDFLKRISDPFWFQALGCVLAYDWHSSGVTTVLTGVLKEAIIPEEHGLAVCGGKGRASRQTPVEIESVGERFSFSTGSIATLQYASKMSAKVDNTAVQAGYQLYHHAFLISEDGKWAVIQQGMCPQDRTARRYHWLSENIQNFVIEPHNAIVGDARRDAVLDMTSRESEGSRRASVDIAREKPEKIMRMIIPNNPTCQKSLQDWLPKITERQSIDTLSMPRGINWKTLKQVYDFQPRNYEELLGFKGVGPATVRGLALVAELVYGEKPSWKDPVKYSFAYGGKDGVPFPVDRKAMDESIQVLKQAIQEAKFGDKEKMRSLHRLSRFVPQNINQ